MGSELPLEQNKISRPYKRADRIITVLALNSKYQDKFDVR
jgi:hypothetical protein